MSVTDTIRQIKSGLWAIEPHYGISLRDTVEKILTKQTNDTLSKEDLEATHYLIDEKGDQFRSSSINEAGPGSIGVIRITGPMIKYGNPYCWGADELVVQAKKFDNNENIIGQIWVFDTGGGAVNSVAPYREFLATKKKPVLSWCDMCASAGVWVATGTNYIMAQNNISASFGSIGVMASLRNTKKYFQDMGVIDHKIYAEQSEHKNKAFDLALEGEFDLIRKEHLNPLAIKFQERVKADLPGLNLNVKGIISGRMFYADQALEHGLIHGIGRFDQAVDKLIELAAVQEIMNN